MTVTVETALRRHLAEASLLGASAAAVADDDNLFEFVDSLQMLRLIAHLEKMYRIEIEDFEMVPENMRSLRALATLVQGKLRPGQARAGR